MNCEKVQELVPELVANQLPDGEQKLVRSHLDGCPVCQRELEKQKSLTSGLKAFYEKISPGKKPYVFSPPPDPKPSPAIWSRFWIFGTSVALAIILGVLIFPANFFLQKPAGKPDQANQPSQTFQTAGKTETLLQSGILSDLSKKSTWQKGSSLQNDLAYEALEESSIEHNKRTLFQVNQGAKFELALNGVSLLHGGARFQVQPGSSQIQIRTPNAVIGVLGTQFDVVVAQRTTVVHLLKGRVQIESGNKLFLMESGDVTFTALGSETRKIPLSEGLWAFFTKNRKDWETLLHQRLFPEGQGLQSSKVPASGTEKSSIDSVATISEEADGTFANPLSQQIGPPSPASASSEEINAASGTGLATQESDLASGPSPDMNNPEEAMNGEKN